MSSHVTGFSFDWAHLSWYSKTTKKEDHHCPTVVGLQSFCIRCRSSVTSSSEGHLAGHGHLNLCRGTEHCTAETERSCLAACLWAQRRNLSRESARNAAPNSSLKLLRVLLQVKLGARLVNSVHQQRLLSFNLSKYCYDICKSNRYMLKRLNLKTLILIYWA